jgi:esterase/lipase superfamily enzyme
MSQSLKISLMRSDIRLRSRGAPAALLTALQDEGRQPDEEWQHVAIACARAVVRLVRALSIPAAEKNPTKKEYLRLLSSLWYHEASAGPQIVGDIDASYLTLFSVTRLAVATSAQEKSARLRGEAACAGLAGQRNQRRLASLRSAFTATLKERDVTSIGQLSPNAWKLMANLPIPPGGTTRSAAKGKTATKRTGAAKDMSSGDLFLRSADTETMATAPNADADAGRLYDVWFGTNRAPTNAAEVAKGFTNKRDPAGAVRYGVCKVKIPKTHKFGSTGTSFIKRWLRLEFTSDRVALAKILPIASDEEFFGALGKELQVQAEADRSVLIYLHGYNTSFEEAAIRAAQMGFDLKVPGATAFFSWPSHATIKGYPADIASIEASEQQIADFLTATATQAGATKVHIIAHSMGNRGFGRAIQRITSAAAASSGIRFGQIILAAPDVDVDLFTKLAKVYPTISDRTTMYVSAKDKALGFSKFLQDSDRAGFTPPVTVLAGIDTIEVTSIDLSLLGHGYYAEAAPILYDMKELMDSGNPPQKRLRIEPLTEGLKNYWTVRP